MQKLIDGLLYDTDNAKRILKYKDGTHKNAIYKANNGVYFSHLKRPHYESLDLLTVDIILKEYGTLKYDNRDSYPKMLPQYKNDLIYLWLFFRKEFSQLKKQYPHYNYKNCQIIYKKGPSRLCKNKLGELFQCYKSGFFDGNSEDERIGIGFKTDNPDEYDKYIFDYIETLSLKDAEEMFPKFAYNRA